MFGRNAFRLSALSPLKKTIVATPTICDDVETIRKPWAVVVERPAIVLVDTAIERPDAETEALAATDAVAPLTGAP